MKMCIALVAALSLLAICSAERADYKELLARHARSLSQYEGSSTYPGGETSTVDNGDGTSTTCTTGQYYNGCSTYPNGRKLMSASEAASQAGHARSLSQYEGGSTYPGGSTTTTDNGDGTSTTCTTGEYYNGCSTYPNGRKLMSEAQAGHARGLSQYEGSSTYPGGSTTTTDNGDGTSTTCTTGEYYNGCSTYPNGRKLMGAKNAKTELNAGRKALETTK